MLPIIHFETSLADELLEDVELFSLLSEQPAIVKIIDARIAIEINFFIQIPLSLFLDFCLSVHITTEEKKMSEKF